MAYGDREEIKNSWGLGTGKYRVETFSGHKIVDSFGGKVGEVREGFAGIGSTTHNDRGNEISSSHKSASSVASDWDTVDSIERSNRDRGSSRSSGSSGKGGSSRISSSSDSGGYSGYDYSPNFSSRKGASSRADLYFTIIFLGSIGFILFFLSDLDDWFFSHLYQTIGALVVLVVLYVLFIRNPESARKKGSRKSARSDDSSLTPTKVVVLLITLFLIIWVVMSVIDPYIRTSVRPIRTMYIYDERTREMKGFRARLTERQKIANTLVCVGLDPVIEKMPEDIRASSPTDSAALVPWYTKIVDETAPFASMFKPQHAHWEAVEDGGGLAALRAVIAHIRTHHPDIPIFMDCKRGDIGRTQTQYGIAHFDLEGVDGMNYNGYMGRDTLEALVDEDHPERSLVGLGRTSNPAAWEMQDIYVNEQLRYWEYMVQCLHRWSRELGVLENAGVVMGAAHKDPANEDKIYSEHLARAREIVGNDMWLLIPGIGTQGGFVEQTIQACYTGPGSVAINSSSGLNFPEDGDCGGATRDLRDQLNDSAKAVA